LIESTQKISATNKKVTMEKTEKVIQTKEEAMVLLGDINNYDKYIVCFSGGKDSIALVLYLFELGVDRSRIELWHHDIDGEVKPEEKNFMDWAVTKGYCEAFASAFGLPIFFSWREGGFKREMLRKNQPTGDIFFEDENHSVVRLESRKGERYNNTRLKFPQVSADLSTRWCSAYLKIDVCASAIRNQERFSGIRTLVLTGERGEESSARGSYNIIEPDRSDLRDGRAPRLVDHFRPVRDWKEEEIWAIMERFRVRPHPAYEMGFGRVSCMKCIFGNADQFASAFKIDPVGTQEIADYEKEFGVTIKRKESVEDLVAKGTPYHTITDELAELSMSRAYTKEIILPEGEEWVLPAGAFGESCGPI
jgi:3'-phosphoadenosine 5'-phosphosulfate sulfotransferase (PAPS reductase)/FAD synthetase